MNDLGKDLHERWLPSPDQRKRAEALLRTMPKGATSPRSQWRRAGSSVRGHHVPFPQGVSMSVRIHWTASPAVNVSVFNATETILDPYSDEELPAGMLRLVIEDGGNMEAMVIDGTIDDLHDLAESITKRASVAYQRS